MVLEVARDLPVSRIRLGFRWVEGGNCGLAWRFFGMGVMGLEECLISKEFETMR